jgi:hypothetical protein
MSDNSSVQEWDDKPSTGKTYKARNAKASRAYFREQLVVPLIRLLGSDAVQSR